MSALVGPGAERIGLLRGGHARFAALPDNSLSAARAATTKARIFCGSLSPGASLDPRRYVDRIRARDAQRLGDIGGVEPARKHERHAGIDPLQQRSSRTPCRARRAASPRAARGHRTAASRRHWHRRRSAKDRPRVSIGSAFITGSRKRERTDATRSGASLPCSCSMSGLSASIAAVSSASVGVDRQRNLLRPALHPLAQSLAPPRARYCAATAERTRSRPCRRRRPARRRAPRGSSGRRS